MAAVPGVWEGDFFVHAESDLHTHRLRDDVGLLRRLVSASQDALAVFCEALGRSSRPALLLDRLDERLALARRAEFGRRLWLLSWHRRPDATWTARLSGPGFERTVERSARTRAFAISRAARASGRIREFRERTRSRPGLDPDSRHAATP